MSGSHTPGVAVSGGTSNVSVHNNDYCCSKEEAFRKVSTTESGAKVSHRMDMKGGREAKRGKGG